MSKHFSFNAHNELLSLPYWHYVDLYILNVFKIQRLLINLKHFNWENYGTSTFLTQQHFNWIYLQKLKFKKLELGQWVWGISHYWIGYLELFVYTRCQLNHHLIWSLSSFSVKWVPFYHVHNLNGFGLDMELIQSKNWTIKSLYQNFIF